MRLPLLVHHFCVRFSFFFFFELLPMAMGIADLNNQTLLAIVSLFISLEFTGEILLF
jgi:hypothetical protein